MFDPASWHAPPPMEESDEFLPDDVAVAAHEGDVYIVDEWLRAGGLVDAKDSDDQFCLLQIALMAQDVALVRCVIAHGADVNRTDHLFPHFNTPLALCLRWSRGDSACFYAMLEAGARVKPSDLLTAAASCSEEIVGEVLRRGGDVHYEGYGMGWTPMHAASTRGNPGVIALLLKHGARVDYLSSEGRSPLMAAAQDPHLPDDRQLGDHQTCATVRLLLAHGADLRAVDNKSRTARDFAVSHQTSMESQLESQVNAAWKSEDEPPWISDLSEGESGGYEMSVEARAKILKAASVVALFDEIYAAGSWKRYANEPRVQLLMLRCLCAKGRAAPPPGMFASLLALPTAIFWSVLSFWRTSRDA